MVNILINSFVDQKIYNTNSVNIPGNILNYKYKNFSPINYATSNDNKAINNYLRNEYQTNNFSQSMRDKNYTSNLKR